MSSPPRTRRRARGLDGWPPVCSKWARARDLGALAGAGLVAALSSLGCGDNRERVREISVELGPCQSPEANVGLADAKCGILTVEENRGAPNGRTIDLAILVAPALSRTPAPDPILFLAGGPGQGAASLAPRLLHRLEPLRRDRDIVFVDVRGTGRSNELVCNAEDPEDLAQLLAAQIDLDELGGCLADYENAGGVDLGQYTSSVMVQDLDEVRAALGYDQVNLLGISHGTLVAQLYMARYGDHVRSAVLDGIVPTDVEIFAQLPANAEAVLERVLADCREDRDCAASFPGLERKLAVVLTDLETNRALETFAHPKTGEPVRVDVTREGFMSAMIPILYSGHSRAMIPMLIERAHAGELGPLAAEALTTARYGESIAMGLYFSVACAEDLASLSEARRREAVRGLEYFDDHQLELLERSCARWPHAPLDPARRQPVTAAAPTLLLSGAYDPVTPPSFAEHLAGSLADARSVVVDQLGHGVWSHGCAPELIAAFFATPDTAAVDPSCFDTLTRPPAFLTANGPWLPHRGEADAASPGELHP